MKVYLHTIGCRLNQSEMDTLGRRLLTAGHELVADPAQADKIVLNTCAVTAEAARDARNLTRRFAHQNDTAEIWLTGCYVTISPADLERTSPAVRLVANAAKEQLPHLLDPTLSLDVPIYELEPILRQFRTASLTHTRAFIKVQDGCDNRCTFCVTTLARGNGRSRPIADVLPEIQALTAAGYREVVLTGVHLGSYGRDLTQPTGLKQLVQAILTDTDIPRLRLSSLEPWDIANGFFDLWQNPRLLPHLHLPLQSGSDTVLRRMARRTNQADFRALVAQARAAIPDLNLSTDMIVGFPGETEAEFAHSQEFVAQIGFSRLHVFPYSARPGTAAARMTPQIPKAVKKARVEAMTALGQTLGLAFHQRYVGQTMDVLWETGTSTASNGRHWAGYTHNYLRVHTTHPTDLYNHITPTHITTAHPDNLTGLPAIHG